MIQQGMIHHFHIHNLSYRYTTDHILCFNRYHVIPVSKAIFDSLFQLHLKLVIFYRFQNKIQSINLISLYSILSHICNEDKHHFRIRLADLFRRLHSVHCRHLNVQKKDIIVRPVIFNDLRSIRKFAYCNLLLVFQRIFFNHFPEQFSAARLIFNNSYMQHDLFSFHSSLTYTALVLSPSSTSSTLGKLCIYCLNCENP